MFNIKNKIYVAREGEVQFSSTQRSLILHNQYSDQVAFPIIADLDNKEDIGVTYINKNLEDLVTTNFDGSLSDCYNWIGDQFKIKILTDRSNYITMFVYYVLELKQQFNLNDSQIDTLLQCQSVHEYFESGEVLDFKQQYLVHKDLYTPSNGSLISSTDVLAMPFEIVYSLYKWGCIDKLTANAKIANFSSDLLAGQMHNIVEESKLIIAQSPEILQQYFNNSDIESINEVLTSIDGDSVLSRIYGNSYNFDINDAVEREKIIELCKIIVAHSIDMDNNNEQDLAELDLYIRLFNDNDIDIIDEAKYNFIGTGFVASRSQKFNKILMMNIQ